MHVDSKTGESDHGHPGRMICTAWNLPAIVRWFASRDPDRYRVYSDWSWFEM